MDASRDFPQAYPEFNSRIESLRTTLEGWAATYGATGQSGLGMVALGSDCPDGYTSVWKERDGKIWLGAGDSGSNYSFYPDGKIDFPAYKKLDKVEALVNRIGQYLAAQDPETCRATSQRAVDSEEAKEEKTELTEPIDGNLPDRSKFSSDAQ